MTGEDGERWDAWDDLDLDDWAGSGRPEASAEERAATAARIARDHGRLGPTLLSRHGQRPGPGQWPGRGVPAAGRLPGAPQRPPRRTARRLLGLLVGVALALGFWLAGRPGDPLGAPAPAPRGDGGYAFLDERPDGRPITFDPCREIHYRVRPDGAPPSGEAMLAMALAELHRTTGLVFVDDGPTEEAPRQDRSRTSRWSLRDERQPVLVAWADEDEWPSLAGTVVGEAGPVAESVGRSVPRYTTGQVVLDARDLAHAPGDVAGADAVRLVLLHELGHLVGLAHVDDPSQLMFARSGPGLTGFGTGDLRGLRQLGLGDCA